MDLKDFLLIEQENKGTVQIMGELPLGTVQSMEDVGRRVAKDRRFRPYREIKDTSMFLDKKPTNRTETLVSLTIKEDPNAVKKSGNGMTVKDPSVIQSGKYVNPKTGKWDAIKFPKEDEPFKGDVYEVKSQLRSAKRSREKWSGTREKDQG